MLQIMPASQNVPLVLFVLLRMRLEMLCVLV
nr:MAG TPA: hypothetical protein [Inoviridae sp.]